ncbi:hypothetical protein [Pseudoalteromonas byunsanensis]|uniref:Uncharacterized protein n=1 Tax=Pseudoalteromonas byunsanensis TaxID=327939 RepID=A0A1S1NAZ5_9GAMM|nr:hypothetical protein [Pseudoalteromonas byunsanensis]OHU95879.1 hypothetical protein BIW53_08650 [Pseudoalteromonas byunsanensis]
MLALNKVIGNILRLNTCDRALPKNKQLTLSQKHSSELEVHQCSLVSGAGSSGHGHQPPE